MYSLSLYLAHLSIKLKKNLTLREKISNSHKKKLNKKTFQFAKGRDQAFPSNLLYNII